MLSDKCAAILHLFIIVCLTLRIVKFFFYHPFVITTKQKVEKFYFCYFQWWDNKFQSHQIALNISRTNTKLKPITWSYQTYSYTHNHKVLLYIIGCSWRIFFRWISHLCEITSVIPLSMNWSSKKNHKS